MEVSFYVIVSIKMYCFFFDFEIDIRVVIKLINLKYILNTFIFLIVLFF